MGMSGLRGSMTRDAQLEQRGYDRLRAHLAAEETNMPQPISRREALKLTASLAAAAAFSSISGAATSTSDKPIRMGFIGVGSRGTTLLREVLAQDASVEIPAICDIDQPNLNRAL